MEASTTSVNKDRATAMPTSTPRLTFQASNTHPIVFAADEELRNQIERALARAGYPQLRRIAVDVRDGMVTLSGYVPTYYLKQVAQSAVRSVQDVCCLANDIEVTCGL